MSKITQKVREAAADAKYAHIAKKYGMQNSLRAFWEARAAGVSPALAMAMLEQESGDGANVFGHDPTIFVGSGTVTKAKYLAYKRARIASGNHRMQGVGPLQLTWWSTQDAADKLGGCWIPKYNLRQGYRTLADNIKRYGMWEGVRHYNGSGQASYVYRDRVEDKYAKWHKRLHGR